MQLDDYIPRLVEAIFSSIKVTLSVFQYGNGLISRLALTIADKRNLLAIRAP